MSYFNHAYKKAMLAKAVSNTTSVKAHTLGAGEVACINPSTYSVINTGTASNLGTEFIIAQGNLNKVAASGSATTTAADKLGLGKAYHHGGYTESIKSKNIKTKFITKLWKEPCVDNSEQTITIRVEDHCYTCTDHAQLRIDVVGEEVQRAFNRNLYKVVSSEGCCTMTGSPATPSLTSKNIVDAWRDAINGDELLSQFLSAVSADPTGSPTPTYSTLAITLKADRMTKFDNCSFDTRDWYNTEPLKLILTEVDDKGDACADGCISDNSGVNMPIEGLSIVDLPDSTSGESILRDLILDARYRQEPFNQGNRDSNRFREIEKTPKQLLADVDRNAKYSVYYLQHSVPRYNNPTGVFDNDQYVIQVAAVCSSSEDTALNTMWGKIETQSGVTLETPGAVV